MEATMQNYLPALDLMMCHLGISFEQACEMLGLNAHEQKQLSLLQQSQMD